MTLMKWTLAAAALLAFGAAQADETQAQRIARIAGERCNACHGSNGHGKNPMFPKLAGQNPEYLVDQIVKFKTRVRKGSLMWFQLGDLSETDVDDLAKHYAGQRLQPAPVSDKAMHAAGRALYLQGNGASGVAACASCHGVSGRGAQVMPRLAGQHAEYIAEQLYRFIDGSRERGQTPSHPVASKLTDEEIGAVSYFLASME